MQRLFALVAALMVLAGLSLAPSASAHEMHPAKAPAATAMSAPVTRQASAD